MIRWTLILLASLSLACVEDLSKGFGPADADADADTDADTDPTWDTSISDPDADGVREVFLNAASSLSWVLLDLDNDEIVEEAGPWSVGFQRFIVKVNGGVSGDAGVEAVWQDIEFDDATTAPADGWMTDEPDADDDGDLEYAFDGWFDYDSSTHVVTPGGGTWFVHSAAGDTYALVFRAYYNGAGDAGYPQIAYKPVADSQD